MLESLIISIASPNPLMNSRSGIQPDPNDLVHNPLEEYHQVKQIKLPEQVPASAGGLNKTSEHQFHLLGLNSSFP
jgi:hypothetical protein